MGGTIEPGKPSVNPSLEDIKRVLHSGVKELTFQDFNHIAASVVNAITKPGRDFEVLSHVVLMGFTLELSDPLAAARLKGIVNVAIPGMAVHDMISGDAKHSGPPVNTPLDDLKRILYFETKEITEQDFIRIGGIVANAIGHDREVLDHIIDTRTPSLGELQRARLGGIADVAVAGKAALSMAFGDEVEPGAKPGDIDSFGLG